MWTESTTEQRPPVNYPPSASEVLDLYRTSWQAERTMGDIMRDIMKPILDRVIVSADQRSGFMTARMYEGQRLIGF